MEVFKSQIAIAIAPLTRQDCLGEYSALVAAEALSFKDAVYLVRRRGEFMEEEALKNPARCFLYRFGFIYDKTDLFASHTEIANMNCSGDSDFRRRKRLKRRRLAKGRGANGYCFGGKRRISFFFL